MKIALLADIHSNKIAFDSVLRDIEKESPDKTIFLGDYITDGPNPNEIIKKIEMLGTHVIKGNREDLILNFEPKKRGYLNYNPICTTFDNLSTKSMEYLKSLKDYLIVELCGYKILIIHGKSYFTGFDNLKDMYDHLIDDFDFDLCLFGHIHRFVDETYKGIRFINPGSIGHPMDTPYYKYCYLIIDEQGISIEKREFEVKNTYPELARFMLNSDYGKSNPYWIRLILKMIKDTKDYPVEMMNKLNEKIENLNDISQEMYNSLYVETFKEIDDQYDVQSITE